jgi:hypothetical protein
MWNNDMPISIRADEKYASVFRITPYSGRPRTSVGVFNGTLPMRVYPIDEEQDQCDSTRLHDENVVFE